MKIKVKKKHIDDGEIGSVCNCPIALALKDHFGFTPEYDGVDVGKEYICFNNITLTEKVPARVKRFIENFDTNKKVKPFEFTI